MSLQPGASSYAAQRVLSSFLSALAIVLLCARPCPAQDKRPQDVALEAFFEGRYTEAIELFERCYEQDRDPMHLYNLGRAYQEAGRYDDAHAWFLRYVDTEPSPEGMERARDRLKEVAPLRSAEVTVTANINDARVELDGKGVGLTPFAGRLPPGDHVLAVGKGGYIGAGREVTLKPGEAHAFVFDLSLQPDVVKERLRRAAPWAVVGLGALCAGGGGYLLYRAEELREGVRNADTNEAGQVTGMSQQKAFATRDDADLLATLGIVALSAGAATIIGGTTWAFLQEPSPLPTPSTIQLTPAQGGLFLGWAGSF